MGGQTPVDVAVEIAIRQAEIDMRIHRDGVIGKDRRVTGGKAIKLNNAHCIIKEYRQRTGKEHGVDHFLGVLAQAETASILAYQEAKPGDRVLVGYYRPAEASGEDGEEE